MKRIKIVGLDPSLRNWGIAHAHLDVDTLEIFIDGLTLLETESENGKTVRKNSDDIRRARLMATALDTACAGASVAFCEVPVGSQSARAMASYGMCVGVLGGCPAPLIELSPSEVKIAAVGSKTAGKEEMIEWAVAKYPHAPWLRRGGKALAKNEHLADAIASIHAGLKVQQFLSVLQILRASHGVPA